MIFLGLFIAFLGLPFFCGSASATCVTAGNKTICGTDPCAGVPQPNNACEMYECEKNKWMPVGANPFSTTCTVDNQSGTCNQGVCVPTSISKVSCFDAAI
jgi:hypothetical protein